MTNGIFGDREKALEDQYMRQQDAKLLEKLRQNASLDELAIALAEKLELDDPDLLAKVRGLGIVPQTAVAFFLAPLVEVAWSQGKVGKAEHDCVLQLAQERGVEAGSPAHAQLEDWLQTRPSQTLFDTAVQVIRVGFAALSHEEREERIQRVLDACHEVAAASANKVGRYLGITDGVTPVEASTIDAIAHRLWGR